MQTVEDVRGDIAAGSNINKLLKDIIKDDADERDRALSLFNRYTGEPASNRWDEKNLPEQYDGIPIYKKEAVSPLKVNHRIHNPFIRKIVLNMIGYVGAAQIILDGEDYSEDEKTDIEKIIKRFSKTISLSKQHSNLVERAVLCGRAYLLMYQIKGQISCKVLNSWETIVFNNKTTEEPEYGIRYWQVQYNGSKRWYVELYDSKYIYYFIEDDRGNFTAYNDQSASIIEGTPRSDEGRIPHFMGYMPIVEFCKNEQHLGDAELTLSLQDSYDVSFSDLSSELAQLRQAYLVRKNGTSVIDHKFLAKLTQTGILDGEWSFLTKNFSIDGIKYLEEQLRKNIFDLSNSVDFSDPAFNGAMPIIAFKLKCKGLDDSATELINEFEDAYKYVFRILVAFWKGSRAGVPLKLTAEDLSIYIPKNIPVNETEIIENINGMKEAGFDFKTILEKYIDQLGITTSIDDIMARIMAMNDSELTDPDDVQDLKDIKDQGDDYANSGQLKTVFERGRKSRTGRGSTQGAQST